MISVLRGVIFAKTASGVVIDVQGVGYEVMIPANSSVQLLAEGEQVTLYTYLSVREDGLALYGFSELMQRELFRELIKVNGIGPKLALTILSLDPGEFVQHLAANDASALERIPGIGAKTAKRLLVELRDRVDDFMALGIAPHVTVANTAQQDALSALVALGYKQHDAMVVLREFATQNLTSGELIKKALKRLAQ